MHGSRQGFGCVFDDRHFILLTQRHDGLVVSTLAIYVHDHGSFRKSIELRGATQFFFKQLRVKVPSLTIAIDKHWFCILIPNGIRSGDKGKCRCDDFITCTNAKHPQCKMQRCSPTRHGYCMGRSNIPCELFFKAIDMRSQGCDPVAVESFHQQLSFSSAHVRR